LLDEPTNDLDITTLITLEDYLDSFPGCLIVASHDRYFLDRLVEKIFKFEGNGRIAQYTGNYSALVEEQAAQVVQESENAGTMMSKEVTAPSVQAPAPAPASNQDALPRKLSYKEKRELEEVESRIALAEARVSEIEMEIPLVSSDYVRLQALTSELESLKT